MSKYPETLKYFVWKWQVHFMLSNKVAAESLFEKIDNQLLATSFMIGFATEENKLSPGICYEPEKMEFLDFDISTLNQLNQRFDKTDPKRNMHYTGLGQQQIMDRRRYSENFRKALKKTLDDSIHFKDKIHFIAKEVKRDGYEVYIILQLKKSVYSRYTYLRYIDPEEYLHKHLSFIDSAIDAYLEDRSYRLNLPEAGSDNGPDRPSEEILRAAANRFLFTIALAGNSGRFHSMIAACNEISLIKYESKENMGHLIVCRSGHPALDITLQLDKPFSIDQHRKIRKLLELTSKEIGVITNGELVLGLGRRRNNYDSSKEDFFDIFFQGLHCFDVMHLEQPLLLMRNGVPEQAKNLIDYTQFLEDAKGIFTNITEEQINNLFRLSLGAAKNSKGCMLVFIEDANNEAARLRNQCISIRPQKLDDETVAVLTSIDGALIIDLDGFAHAKGVILDGVVGLEGDSARGSRYNSALTYYEHRGLDKPTMILVVSEDRMIDIIPKLRPRIRHSEIIQFIKTLESINSSEEFNDQTYYNTMDLLTNRSFYLTQQECDHINQLNSTLKLFDEKSGKTVWRRFKEFSPNPKMNDSYYIPE